MGVESIFFNKSVSKPRLDVPTVLLVEGPDDGHFLDEVLTSMKADPTEISVCLANGKDNLIVLLTSILKAPTFTKGTIRRYAVIRDVDDDIDKCNKEVDDLFLNAGEPRPEAGGFQQRTDGRHNGLFLMPDGGRVGSLETLALETIADHPLLVAADNYIDAARQIGGAEDHADKRRTQALLSTLARPLCNGVGWATRGGHFDVTSKNLDSLKSFIADLQKK